MNVIVGFLIVTLSICAGCYVTCTWADDTIEVAPQPQPVRRGLRQQRLRLPERHHRHPPRRTERARVRRLLRRRYAAGLVDLMSAPYYQDDSVTLYQGDCLAGSGTTVEACIIEGFHCVAIEREPDYLPLIEARIARRRNPRARHRAGW